MEELLSLLTARCIHPENAGISLSPPCQLHTWGCVRSAHESCSHLQWFSHKCLEFLFFFYLGFLSQTFMNHRTAREGGGHLFEVGLSPSNNFFLFASMIALQKWWKVLFYFILKALFVLKIFKFLSWLFGYVEKTAWLER